MTELKTIPDPTLDQPVHMPKPVVVFDETESYSVINMVSDKVAEAIKRVDPQMFDKSEGELRKMVSITHTDNALRVSFWREYERAVFEGRDKIATRWIFSGICTEQYFYKFLLNPRKVGWMVRPIQSYQRHMEVILTRGIQRLEEMVEMDIKGKDGEISTRKAELLLKVVTEVGNRVKGLAVQKIQKDERRLIHRTNAPSAALPRPLSNDDLREKLDKLKSAALGKSYVEGQVIKSKEILADDTDIVVVGVQK